MAGAAHQLVTVTCWPETAALLPQGCVCYSRSGVASGNVLIVMKVSMDILCAEE